MGPFDHLVESTKGFSAEEKLRAFVKYITDRVNALRADDERGLQQLKNDLQEFATTRAIPDLMAAAPKPEPPPMPKPVPPIEKPLPPVKEPPKEKK